MYFGKVVVGGREVVLDKYLVEVFGLVREEVCFFWLFMWFCFYILFIFKKRKKLGRGGI